MSDGQVLGKRIFFLFPPVVIQEAMPELVAAGYLVYSIENKTDLLRLLLKFPNSIVYINLDKGKEHEWEDYILTIWDTPGMINIKIGVLTAYKFKKDKYASYYIAQLGIQCGFITVNINKQIFTKILLRILELSEAKGRRKYVRARFESNAFFNLNYNNIKYTGKIKDISVVGAACYFDLEEIQIPPNTPLHNIQLIIKGVICKVSGYIMVVRKQLDYNCTIIMFYKEKIDHHMLLKISGCLYTQLQEDMKKLLEKKRGK